MSVDKQIRRLELKLPPDHPIFEYPPGSRSAIIKMWIDLGQQFELINKRLEAIEQKIDQLSVNGVARNDGTDSNTSGSDTLVFDLLESLNSFE